MQPHEQLELEWATWNNLDPTGMVACSSGTAALHLALEALRLPAMVGVMVPDWSMVACARSVTMAGQVPLFCEVDPDVFLMSHGPYLGRIGVANGIHHVRVKALMPVHTHGRRCPIDYDVVDEEKLFVIEDRAEYHVPYTHLERRPDAAAWSFYKNKVVAGEEGGAVWFKNPDRARLARSLRCLGFTDSHDYRHNPRGHNYRLAPSLANKVLDSLHHYNNNLFRRRSVERSYEACCPDEWKMPPRECPWVYDIRIPGMTESEQRAAVTGLWESGVQARFGFKSLSSQEEYRRHPVCHNSVSASREVISLPLDPSVAEDMTAVRVLRSFDLIRWVVGNK